MQVPDEKFEKARRNFRQMGHTPRESRFKLVKLIRLYIALHAEAEGDLFDRESADDLRILFDLHDFFVEIS